MTALVRDFVNFAADHRLHDGGNLSLKLVSALNVNVVFKRAADFVIAFKVGRRCNFRQASNPHGRVGFLECVQAELIEGLAADPHPAPNRCTHHKLARNLS
jgi:hypothetical protein